MARTMNDVETLRELINEIHGAGVPLEEIELKNFGQLLDELVIMNLRIWHLIDKVMAGTATVEDAQLVQKYNALRNTYVRAINRRVGETDVVEKTYESKGDKMR
jgi:hypothetical protein